MAAITRNHKNAFHSTTTKDRDLFLLKALIYNFSMLSAILDVSHYQKVQLSMYNIGQENESPKWNPLLLNISFQ